LAEKLFLVDAFLIVFLAGSGSDSAALALYVSEQGDVIAVAGPTNDEVSGLSLHAGIRPALTGPGATQTIFCVGL
jgi:hypothetical protein